LRRGIACSFSSPSARRVSRRLPHHTEWLLEFQECLPEVFRKRWQECINGVAQHPPVASKAGQNDHEQAKPQESRWILQRSTQLLKRARSASESRALKNIRCSSGLTGQASKNANSAADGKCKELASSKAPMYVNCAIPAEDAVTTENKKRNPLPQGAALSQAVLGVVEATAPPQLATPQLPLCCVCKHPPVQPKVATFCGHFACSECWRKWHIMRFECPICRIKVRPNNLVLLRGWGE